MNQVYTQEREYQVETDDDRNGPGEPKRQSDTDQQPVLRQLRSESNAQMLSHPGNNEHTSSSLGKRNFNEFLASKESLKLNPQKTTELEQIDEDIEQRVRKTPARKLKGLPRTNSDNFCVE